MSRIQEALEKAEALSRQGEPSPEVLELVSDRSGEGRHCADLASPCLFIGRGPSNDVSFDLFAEPSVSLRHAGVRLEGEEWILYDMGSLNGTFLNDVPVERCVLKRGDSIGLGRNGPRLRVNFSPPRPTRRKPAAGSPTLPDVQPRALAETAEMDVSSIIDDSHLKTSRWTRENRALALIAGALALKICWDLSRILGG
jgi:pSer/pThr/pTyr-binding forkhead associated (FHA) protein